MFERFTERARQVCVLAQDAARRLGDDEIRTAHLLIGVLQAGGIGQEVLERHITAEEIESQIVTVYSPSVEYLTSTQQISYSVESKKALELALRTALSMGHNYIGTEHIAVALAKVDKSDSQTILRGKGLFTDDVLNLVLEALKKPRVTSGEALAALSMTEAAPEPTMDLQALTTALRDAASELEDAVDSIRAAVERLEQL